MVKSIQTRVSHHKETWNINGKKKIRLVEREHGRFKSIKLIPKKPLKFTEYSPNYQEQYVYMTKARLSDGGYRSLKITSSKKYNMNNLEHRKQMKEAIKKKYEQKDVLSDINNKKEKRVKNYHVVGKIERLWYRYTYDLVERKRI